MKTSPSLAGMFKTDHPRPVDRYIDYFGGSEPCCRVGERLTPAGEAPPALAGGEPTRWLEASSA
jgi:hypothetical protein